MHPPDWGAGTSLVSLPRRHSHAFCAACPISLQRQQSSTHLLIVCYRWFAQAAIASIGYRRVHFDPLRQCWQLLSWDGARYQVLSEHATQMEAQMQETACAPNPMYNQAMYQVDAHRRFASGQQAA